MTITNKKRVFRKKKTRIKRNRRTRRNFLSRFFSGGGQEKDIKQEIQNIIATAKKDKKNRYQYVKGNFISAGYERNSLFSGITHVHIRNDDMVYIWDEFYQKEKGKEVNYVTFTPLEYEKLKELVKEYFNETGRYYGEFMLIKGKL